MDIEVLKTNEDTLKLVHRILDQNQIILEQNQQLLRWIANPPMIVSGEDLKPGEIKWRE